MIKRILLAAAATAGMVAATCEAAIPQPASFVAFVTSSLTDSNGNHTIWVTDNAFNNNARIGDPSNAPLGDGTNYWAQIYAAGGAAQPESALRPVNYPVNFLSGADAGFVQDDGKVTDFGQVVNSTVGISNTVAGGPVTIQIRAWWGGLNGKQFTNYEDAAASHVAFMRFGKSGLMTVNPTGDGITPPQDLVDATTGFSDQLAFELDEPPPCPEITLDQSTLPAGTVGFVYSQTLTASGSADVPYTFTVISGALPPGLVLDASGLLHGIPTTTGVASFTVEARDTNGVGCTGSSPYLLTNTCPAIVVTPPTLPPATTGNPYNHSLGGSGGTGPYTFVTNSGALPPGLAMSSGGLISGTPTSSGLFTFSVVATDFYGCQGNGTYTISNNCPNITVSPATVPGGTVGTPYSQPFSAANGSGPYTYSITSGGLPAGLSLSTDTVSGTPTTATATNFTITATDANGCTGSSNYVLNVVCPNITLSPATLANGTLGSNYSQTVTASGGNTNYTFSVSSGALPEGLSLSSGGVISGTPSSNQPPANFTVTATDAYGCTGATNYTISVGCPTITVSPPTLPNAQLTSNYNQTITATGAAGSFTFGVTSGSLPGGVTLSSGGVLSGTPSPAGSYNFTVTATNSNGGCTGSQSYTLTVNSPFPLAAAQWYGLFSDTNGPVSRHTAGYITLSKVANKETFTGKLVLDGQVVNLVGSFDTNGNGSVPLMLVTRLYPKPPLLMSLQVDIANDTISGVISNSAEGWYSTVVGDKYVFSTGNPATQLQGSYTMVLPGSPGDPIQPGGAGGARITVQANGMVLVQLAYTGDGQAFTAWPAPVSKNGQYPLFTQIYGLQGILMGWLNFTPTPTPPAPTFNGDIHWEKPSSAPITGLYNAGFTNDIALVGSGYDPSAPGTDHGIAIVDGVVTVAGGNLPFPFTNTCTIISGIATMNAPVTHLTKLTYASSFSILGLQFSAPVPLPASPLTIGRGWYLQTQNYGDGYFRAPGANQTGDFQLH